MRFYTIYLDPKSGKFNGTSYCTAFVFYLTEWHNIFVPRVQEGVYPTTIVMTAKTFLSLVFKILMFSDTAAWLFSGC